MQSPPDDLQEFATRYTAAWCSQDAKSVAAFFSANGRLSVNDGTPAIGRAAITATVQSFMSAFPDLQVILDKLAVNSDRIEYHWTLIGTNAGPGGTGKPVRTSGMEVWKDCKDGLIARSDGQFDAADYQRQLGTES